MNDLTNTEDSEEQVEIIRGCAGLAYAGKIEYPCHELWRTHWTP